MEHLPLVRGLARRYAERGEPLDDLVQVGHDRPHQGDRPLRPDRAASSSRASRRRRSSARSAATSATAPGPCASRGASRRPGRRSRTRSTTCRPPRAAARRCARSPRRADLSVDDVLDALAAGSAQRPAPLASPGGEGDEDEGIAVGARGRRLRAGRGAGDARRGARRPARARAGDPAPALRGGAHPVADRRRGSASPRCTSRASSGAPSSSLRETAEGPSDRGTHVPGGVVTRVVSRSASMGTAEARAAVRHGGDAPAGRKEARDDGGDTRAGVWSPAP